ncbi:MAG: M14 family zinc carboxypeptidase [Oceanicaulis sp.]
MSRLSRPRGRGALLAGLVSLLAAACQTPGTPAPPLSASCESAPVALTQNFPGAGRSPCTRLGPARFALRIEPEAQPINPSPWYAFDLTRAPGSDAERAEIVLEYAASRHRYGPKVQTEGGWRALPADALTVLDDDRRRAALTVDLAPPGVTRRIAAQPLFPVAERQAWRRGYAERTRFELTEIGRSVQGRPIEAIWRRAAHRDAPVIVILGGQHPPEVPGVIGLRAFLEALARIDAAEGAGLGGAHWLVIPTLNPDGVDAGHWRLNTGLVDLNRDWGPFTQPETAAARDAIAARLEGRGPPLMLLDFHATWRDVLYVPAGSQPDKTHPRVAHLVGAIEAALPEGQAGFAISPGHNPATPSAKTWFLEAYGEPGVTVEFGDETDSARITALATALADAVARCCQTKADQPQES